MGYDDPDSRLTFATSHTPQRDTHCSLAHPASVFSPFLTKPWFVYDDMCPTKMTALPDSLENNDGQVTQV